MARLPNICIDIFGGKNGINAAPVCEFDTPAIDFMLPGTDGQEWSLENCRGKNATLVMFICNHCPYVKAIQDRLVEDTLKLKTFGVNSVAIMSNDTESFPDDSFENMKKLPTGLIIHSLPAG